MKYRKKPVVVEAIQWTGENAEDLAAFMEPTQLVRVRLDDGVVIAIPTLEGVMIANVGDWIIKGVAGEFYPCKPDIFEQTHEDA